MADIDYLIRDDDIQKIFISESNIDVVDTLKTYYNYIYDSILEEGFILKYDKCNLFKELIYENKVVGFCSYDHSREFITAALNNIYILPEFRGKGIFLRELQKTMLEHNKPSIMEPTRLVVEILIKYGFASKINDDIVASAIEFVIPGNHVLSNFDYGNDELSTHYYDLSICSCIHILNWDKKHIAYSAPLNYDLIHYDKIGQVNDEYVDNLIEFYKNNDVKLMEVILKLEDNLPIINYTLEEIIGDEDNFSFYIESLIDDAHVTHKKALEIKQQIKEEYEAGMILNESLLIRLAYLFKDNQTPTITSHVEVCPYCNMPIDDHDRFCHFCGINLDYDPYEMQNNLFDSLNTQKSDFVEDIRFIAYKFLKLISEKIEVEYSIFTIENTYNIEWNELDNYLTANNYFVNNEITAEGNDFLVNHPLHFWENYHMDIVDYTDFENYFYNYPDLNPLEICLNYLKQFDNDDFVLEIVNEIKSDLK